MLHMHWLVYKIVLWSNLLNTLLPIISEDVDVAYSMTGWTFVTTQMKWRLAQLRPIVHYLPAAYQHTLSEIIRGCVFIVRLQWFTQRFRTLYYKLTLQTLCKLAYILLLFTTGLFLQWGQPYLLLCRWHCRAYCSTRAKCSEFCMR